MRFYCWDENMLARYLASRLIPLLDRGEREGKWPKELVVNLPSNVVKFSPPKRLMGKVAGYVVELTLRWYGFNTASAVWTVKYRIKVRQANAFTNAFMPAPDELQPKDEQK